MNTSKTTMILLLLASFSYCNDKDANENKVLVAETTETTTIFLGNVNSDKLFSQAIKEFENKNTKESVKHFEDGIGAYEIETKDATGRIRIMANEGLKSLKKMAEKIASGKVKSVQEIEATVYSAERAVTRQMVIEVENKIRVPETVSESPSYFSKVLKGIKSEVKEWKGDLKEEGDKIVAKGEAIEAKFEKKEKITKDLFIDFYQGAKKLF